MCKIVAVIVAYHPDFALLSRVVESTAQMVERVIVVNNDGGNWSHKLPEPTVVYTPPKNIGLAAAYNYGAEQARKSGATHVLLLDQDSVPAAGMVQRLLEPYSKGGRIGGVGPIWKDPRSGQVGGFTVAFGTNRVPESGETLTVDFLISSGSLIVLSALEELGPFDETLFIEHVDTEWALRAKAKGFSLYGVAGAVLEHTIGDAAIALPYTNRKLFLYPPERTYYLVRNSVRLWFRPYATWRWRLADFRRLGALLVLHLIFAPDRAKRSKMIAYGLRDVFKHGVVERSV
jgi:rhamnosyltransferase